MSSACLLEFSNGIAKEQMEKKTLLLCIFLPLNSKVPLPQLPLALSPIFFLKILWHFRAQYVSWFLGSWARPEIHPSPTSAGRPKTRSGREPLILPGLSAKRPWMDEVSECGGEGELTQGPQRKLSSLCPPPDTQGGSPGCSWQLWLQLCCCTLPECVTGPNVPGRYPMRGLESLIWFCVLPQTAQSSPKQQFRMVGEGPIQRPSWVSLKPWHLQVVR